MQKSDIQSTSREHKMNLHPRDVLDFLQELSTCTLEIFKLQTNFSQVSDNSSNRDQSPVTPITDHKWNPAVQTIPSKETIKNLDRDISKSISELVKLNFQPLLDEMYYDLSCEITFPCLFWDV